MKTPIPEDFKTMLRDLTGCEANLLLEALEQPPLTSVRLNRRKNVTDFPGSSPVAWCESGLYLEKRPEFIFDPLLHAGAYYVQDASSMIYETVVKRLLPHFYSDYSPSSPTPYSYAPLNILDLCAAPGGKTTAIINAIPDGCRIVANEYSPKRVGALRENIERWGYPLVSVTNKSSDFFASQGAAFDIVAVDAPCSGEGMMRKEEVARVQWSPKLVEQCASLQKEILRNANEALRPGGFLIFSTCTFNRRENEENAEWVVNELGLIPYDLELPEEWGIPGGINTDLPVYRFMPHITKGEGLFLAVFRKVGDPIPLKEKPAAFHPQSGNPSPGYPTCEIDQSTAIKYLRGESLVLPPDQPKGIITLTYKGLPLGEVKNIGSRANNLYPKHKRILKR